MHGKSIYLLNIRCSTIETKNIVKNPFTKINRIQKKNQTSVPWNSEPAPFGFNKWNFVAPFVFRWKFGEEKFLEKNFFWKKILWPHWPHWPDWWPHWPLWSNWPNLAPFGFRWNFGRKKKLKKKFFWKKILLVRLFRLVDTLSTLVDTLSTLVKLAKFGTKIEFSQAKWLSYHIELFFCQLLVQF